MKVSLAEVCAVAWRKARPCILHPDGYEFTAAEQTADSLINAWGCSAGLLVGVAVLAATAPLVSLSSAVGGVFLRLQGIEQLFIALSLPFLMVLAKTVAPRIYGGVEVVIGGVIVTIAIDKLNRDGSGAAWISLFAAIYWMARGAQNLSDGFTARARQRRDERLVGQQTK
jgi:hypothetical protein